jgi:patatin-like phospholipase/acyl hydrolase
MSNLEALTTPKTEQAKLLALDGGGIRGIITIEILAKIEKILQEKLGKDDTFVLADYFDYIAGTSTGAIIAACLSWGMRIDEIREFYIDSGERMFDQAFLLKRFRFKFDDKNLANQLKSIFREETLGSNQLKTLLMMVMRNATTDSPWPISNNPYARYNQKSRTDCNLNFPLWQLIRASTAAPTFFPPEVIDINNGQPPFIFVDGGITAFNNPAFQLFLMATTEPYKLNWDVGEDKMLLVSVGTGMTPDANKNLQPGEMNLLYNATSIPSALMYASQVQQDFLCRAFGKCLAGELIDREIGDMIGKKGPGNSKLFTYVRYNAELSRAGLDELGLQDIQEKDVQPMDSVKHIDKLQRVGEAIAQQKVKEAHF